MRTMASAHPPFDWVRENLVRDDGKILYCPECHRVTTLAFCGHGFDIGELMPMGEEQASCVEAVPCAGDILLIENEDYPEHWYAYYEPPEAHTNKTKEKA